MQNFKKASIAAAALILSAGAAQASDLNDYRAPDLGLVKPAISWTGFQLGVHGGGAWGDAAFTGLEEDWGVGSKFIGPHEFDMEGYLVGFTAAYNQQFGNFVFGPEAEVGYMNLGDGGSIPSSTSPYEQRLTFDDGLYAVLGGRIGVAFGRGMIYGKGGWAYFDGAARQETTKPGYVTNESEALTGWAYGGGAEYLLQDNVSLKVEYLRFDFGNQGGDQTSTGDAPIGHVYEYDADLKVDTVKAGISYKF